MKIFKTILSILSWSIVIISSQQIKAQTTLVSEPVFQLAVRLSANLPGNIHESYQQFSECKSMHDSLEQLLKEAYPTLAGKMEKRSARLNAMTNDNAEGATLLLMPPNQKMADFFMTQWEKMDALEKAFNQAAPSFFGSKELYGKKGYLSVWDSVYRQRRPALIKYRDGILALVRANMAYLKANAKMFTSKLEAERMQWVEAELGVLQKLVLLESKCRKLLITDGAEKVRYCHDYPSTCD